MFLRPFIHQRHHLIQLASTCDCTRIHDFFPRSVLNQDRTVNRRNKVSYTVIATYHPHEVVAIAKRPTTWSGHQQNKVQPSASEYTKEDGRS